MNRNDYVPPSRSKAWLARAHNNYIAQIGHRQREQSYSRSEPSRHSCGPSGPKPSEVLPQQRLPLMPGHPYRQNNSQQPRTPSRNSHSSQRTLSFPYHHGSSNSERHCTPPRYSRSTQNDLLSPPNTHRVASSMDSFKYPSHDSGGFLHCDSCPVQSRCLNMTPRTLMPTAAPSHSPLWQTVGDPRLKIYRVQLPSELLHLLNTIVQECEKYAAGRSKGWRTDLFSLTKHDLPLRNIPDADQAAKPIVSYMKEAIANLYDVRTIRLDRNQPHVKKYCAEDGSGHTGVELHYDKSDVTANLCMSNSTSYVGGGTCFPDANAVVRLEFGEFLLHPGQLVHSGMNITGGTRYLMVVFANTE